MTENSDYADLFAIFPELQAPDVILQKETLAHFGLLFSGYARLEAAVQNCFVFWSMYSSVIEGRVKTQEEWERNADAFEQKAFKATFGTLLKYIKDCPELAPHMENLGKLKSKRDYFAHHFFREENEKLFSDETTLHLISRMDALRREVEVAEVEVQRVSHTLFGRIHRNIDLDEVLPAEMQRLRQIALEQKNKTVGWEDN